ncbi:MAG: septum formation initiator family protein [Pseudomonadales bacterium]|nr:septum formation initiator family protein [Pseudomonadales bacterium]MCP5182846.1 septum formation initiator family protein [Pseudomonadales bacterium]
MLAVAAIIPVLLYRGWVGGMTADRLAVELKAQEARVAEITARNQVLAAEVRALQTGTDGIEARARLDLGMIREGEIFVLMPEDAH